MEIIQNKQDDFISVQLAKFDDEINPENLKALVAKYSKLEIKDVNDKEGYEALRKGRIELKTERVKINKVAKAMRDVGTRFNKAVSEKEEGLVDIIEPLEIKLRKREDQIDEEKEALAQEKQRAEDLAIQDRIDLLRNVGLEMDYVEIKGLTDEQFDKALEDATDAYTKRKEEERIESERLDKEREEEEKRLADEKKSFEIMQAKLKEEAEKKEEENRIERERLQKIKDEQDKIAIEQQREKERLAQAQLQLQKQKIETRSLQMFAIGFRFDGAKMRFMSLTVEMIDVAKASDVDFATNLDFWAEQIKVIKENAEKEILAEKERVRLQAIKDQEEAAEKERLRKEEEARLAEEKKTEELNASSDSNKFKVFATDIQVIMENPLMDTLKSKKGRDAAVQIIDLMNQAIVVCQSQIKK